MERVLFQPENSRAAIRRIAPMPRSRCEQLLPTNNTSAGASPRHLRTTKSKTQASASRQASSCIQESR